MENDTILSADKARQILHISKRKCAWMLQNGIIPCRINGKKTRCYEIRYGDLMAFIDDSLKHPEKYHIPQIFSSASSTTAMPPDPPDSFAKWLDCYWSGAGDLLSPTDVEELTGYCQTAVNCWLRREYLRSVIAHGQYIVKRDWLIGFMCGYGWRIIRKSEKHRKIVREFYAGESQNN